MRTGVLLGKGVVVEDPARILGPLRYISLTDGQ